MTRFHRRRFCQGAFGTAVGLAVMGQGHDSWAFGDQTGVFDPRALLTGSETTPPHGSAAARWSAELIARTSAPARLRPTTVRADDNAITDSPFLHWSGRSQVAPLSTSEIAGLRKFLALGGVLLIDDASVRESASGGDFLPSARRELARVLPDAAPIALPPEHVIYRTFYLLRRAEGRILGPRTLEGIVRGGKAQVILSAHDIGGALARSASGVWESDVTPGGEAQRERAIRLAVNIAMYVLCSNYKDDQVHAPFLMRRRASFSASDP